MIHIHDFEVVVVVLTGCSQESVAFENVVRLSFPRRRVPFITPCVYGNPHFAVWTTAHEVEVQRSALSSQCERYV